MLYDPKWNYVANPLEADLNDLISWLETKSPDETYDYSNSQDCLLCRFLKGRGLLNPVVNTTHWFKHSNGLGACLPPNFDRIAKGYDSTWVGLTYGDALQRAKNYRQG